MTDSINKYPAGSEVSIADVIKSLYLTLLGREISEADLIQQLSFYSQNEFSVVRAVQHVISSQEFSNGIESFLSRYNITYSKDSWQSLSNQTNTAIIAVLDEIWFPFCLAIADYLYEEYGLNALFVSYSRMPQVLKSIKTSKSNQGILYVDDLNVVPESFNPAIIVAHSFGWGENTEKLMEKYPYTPLLIYGDGYKNSASLVFDKLRPVQTVFMFGFDDDSCPNVKRITLSSDAVNYYRKLLSETHSFSQLLPENEPKKYSVFYMRYWGRGVYSGLSSDKIIESWKNTVLPNISPSETLIIKNDPRVNVDLYKRCIESFRSEGVNVIPFEEYLSAIGAKSPQLGLLPVEYFYLNGLLCSADAHFTLDSALSYSLAVQPGIKRPCRIYVGADDSLFDSNEDQLVISNILYSLNVYSKGLLQSSEVGNVVSVKGQGSLLRCFELK